MYLPLHSRLVRHLSADQTARVQRRTVAIRGYDFKVASLARTRLGSFPYRFRGMPVLPLLKQQNTLSLVSGIVGNVGTMSHMSGKPTNQELVTLRRFFPKEADDLEEDAPQRVQAVRTRANGGQLVSSRSAIHQTKPHRSAQRCDRP